MATTPRLDDPDDPLLGHIGFAARLTERGKPTKASTIRSYKRVGLLPVPDLQIGGHWPEEGETIPAWPNRRAPREGEKIGSDDYWLQSTVDAWDEKRSGPGRWAYTRQSSEAAAS